LTRLPARDAVVNPRRDARADADAGQHGHAHRAGDWQTFCMSSARQFEIADCDLKPFVRSGLPGTLVEMSEQPERGPSLELISLPAIRQRILFVRERHVMLDEGLARLYGVETRRLTEQVKRNKERFPPDFMFQLTKGEAAALRSQSATSDASRGGRRYAPYVFTEQGVAMLSSVLRSKRAVAVNIAIMRAFVELRRAAASYVAIERRLEDLERETQAKLGRHDQQLDTIFKALRQLISPPPRAKRRIGFAPPEDEA
jgi:hypothetical protein